MYIRDLAAKKGKKGEESRKFLRKYLTEEEKKQLDDLMDKPAKGLIGDLLKDPQSLDPGGRIRQFLNTQAAEASGLAGPAGPSFVANLPGSNVDVGTHRSFSTGDAIPRTRGQGGSAWDFIVGPVMERIGFDADLRKREQEKGEPNIGSFGGVAGFTRGLGPGMANTVLGLLENAASGPVHRPKTGGLADARRKGIGVTRAEQTKDEREQLSGIGGIFDMASGAYGTRKGFGAATGAVGKASVAGQTPDVSFGEIIEKQAKKKAEDPTWLEELMLDPLNLVMIGEAGAAAATAGVKGVKTLRGAMKAQKAAKLAQKLRKTKAAGEDL